MPPTTRYEIVQKNRKGGILLRTSFLPIMCYFFVTVS